MSDSRQPAPLIDNDDDDWELTAEDLAFFKAKLIEARDDVAAKMRRQMGDALGGTDALVEEVDLANREVEQTYQLKLADKGRKLMSEISRALGKLETGEYGICEGTDEMILRKRLELRPWTRYSVAFKEQLEREKGGPGRR